VPTHGYRGLVLRAGFVNWCNVVFSGLAKTAYRGFGKIFSHGTMSCGAIMVFGDVGLAAFILHVVPSWCLDTPINVVVELWLGFVFLKLRNCRTFDVLFN
jgi:hypothetical protein